MATRRTEQIGDLLRVELSELLQREMRDPRLGFVTVTGVRVSTDLQHARVLVSCYGDEEAQHDSLRALRSAAGFLRTEISKRIRLRTTPQLTFQLDHSLEHAEKVQRTLNALAPELAASAAREREEAAANAAPETDETTR